MVLIIIGFRPDNYWKSVCNLLEIILTILGISVENFFWQEYKRIEDDAPRFQDPASHALLH